MLKVRPSTDIETARRIEPEVDRSVIDAIAGRRMRHRAIGSANIDVNVKGEGQKSVSQVGPFRKVRLERVTAMERADAGPDSSPEGSGGGNLPVVD